MVTAVDILNIETRIESEREFEDAYRALHLRALRWAAAITRDEDAAQDVVQDAFIHVFSRVRVLRDSGALEFYVRRAVVNAALSRARSDGRRRAREARAAADRPAPSDVDSELWLRVTRLPRRQFAAIALRYWVDLTEADTARMMRCRPGTVKSLTSQALSTLRAELGNG